MTIQVHERWCRFTYYVRYILKKSLNHHYGVMIASNLSLDLIDVHFAPQPSTSVELYIHVSGQRVSQWTSSIIQPRKLLKEFEIQKFDFLNGAME